MHLLRDELKDIQVAIFSEAPTIELPFRAPLE
jgi:hypothetical protein